MLLGCEPQAGLRGRFQRGFTKDRRPTLHAYGIILWAGSWAESKGERAEPQHLSPCFLTVNAVTDHLMFGYHILSTVTNLTLKL